MNRLLCIVALAAVTAGCAEDSAPESESKQVASEIDVAYLGLTVMDCQAEATQCVRNGRGRFLRATLDCSVRLNACLADLAVQTAGRAAGSATEVLACGTSSVECVASSAKLSEVLACEANVETCVVDRVDDLTGIRLPTTRDVVGEAAGVVGDVLDTGVEVVGTAVDTTVHVADTAVGAAVDVASTTAEVAGTVVGTTVEVAGTAVEAGVEVVGTAVDVTVGTAGTVIDTAAGVAGSTVETAGGVIQGTVETAGEVVGGTVAGIGVALDCSAEARSCWRTQRDLLACQKSYRECLAKK